MDISLWAEYAAGKPLTPEDTVRLEASLACVFFGMENLFRQYERGLLDSDTWENLVRNMPRVTPTMLDRWRVREGPLAKRLLAHLESRNML